MIIGFFLFYWGRIWEDTSNISALPEAFANYAKLILSDGFGVSSRYEIPTLELLSRYVPYTILLLGTAVVISVFVGTLAGLISSWKRNGATDRSLTAILLIPFAVPTVWLARTALYWLSFQFPLFPLARSFGDQWMWDPNFPPPYTNASVLIALELGVLAFGLAVILSRSLGQTRDSPWKIAARLAIYALAIIGWTGLVSLFVPSALTGFALDVLWHLFLPCTLLVLAMTYLFFLTARNSAIEVLSEDYILTAKAKGLRTSTILLKHAFRNSMLPTIALAAQSMTIILGLELIVEIVFTWHGLGMMIFNAVYLSNWFPIDYPALIALLFVLSAIVTIGNAIGDITAHYLSPSLRRAREIEVQ
jgi:ABC-type dipeptide/oligopeptide/nickel transport system permease component